MSVVLHGASATPAAALYARKVANEVLDEERAGTASDILYPHHESAPRISPAELHALLQGPDPPVVLDVRTRSQYEHDDGMIPTSIRVEPGEIVDWIHQQDRKRTVVAYCT